jgi:hypothetical protein
MVVMRVLVVGCFLDHLVNDMHVFVLLMMILSTGHVKG